MDWYFYCVQVSGGYGVEAGNEAGGDQSAEISRLKQQVSTSQPELSRTFFPKYRKLNYTCLY